MHFVSVATKRKHMRKVKDASKLQGFADVYDQHCEKKQKVYEQNNGDELEDVGSGMFSNTNTSTFYSNSDGDSNDDGDDGSDDRDDGSDNNDVTTDDHYSELAVFESETEGDRDWHDSFMQMEECIKNTSTQNPFREPITEAKTKAQDIIVGLLRTKVHTNTWRHGVFTYEHLDIHYKRFRSRIPVRV